MYLTLESLPQYQFWAVRKLFYLILLFLCVCDTF